MATVAAILKNLLHTLTQVPLEGFQRNLMGMFSTHVLLNAVPLHVGFSTKMVAMAAILKNLFHNLTQFQRNLIRIFSTHP